MNYFPEMNSIHFDVSHPNPLSLSWPSSSSWCPSLTPYRWSLRFLRLSSTVYCPRPISTCGSSTSHRWISPLQNRRWLFSPLIWRIWKGQLRATPYHDDDRDDVYDVLNDSSCFVCHRCRCFPYLNACGGGVCDDGSYSCENRDGGDDGYACDCAYHPLN